MAREGKGKRGLQGHRGQGKRDLEEGRVGNSIKEVKWNDPKKCLVEFHKEVIEDV